MHGGQRLFNTAKTGQRDRRSEVAALLQAPKQLEAVHARHDQIGNQDVRLEVGETFQRFLPVSREPRVEVALGKHAGQSGTLALIVVDDKDPARNWSQSGHPSYSSKRLREGFVRR